MTVRELIALLATCPPDAVVLTEGCDCTGLGDGIDDPGPYDLFSDDKGYARVEAVRIGRNDSHEYAESIKPAHVPWTDKPLPS